MACIKQIPCVLDEQEMRDHIEEQRDQEEYEAKMKAIQDKHKSPVQSGKRKKATSSNAVAKKAKKNA
jgi:hypothetical protein